MDSSEINIQDMFSPSFTKYLTITKARNPERRAVTELGNISAFCHIYLDLSAVDNKTMRQQTCLCIFSSSTDIVLGPMTEYSVSIKGKKYPEAFEVDGLYSSSLIIACTQYLS